MDDVRRPCRFPWLRLVQRAQGTGVRQPAAIHGGSGMIDRDDILESVLAKRMAKRIQRASHGPPHIVTIELIATLGEIIGKAPYRDRQAILDDVIAHLMQYVRGIPP